MSIKRLSVRFNLEKEAERNAWEKLDGLSSISKNRAIIESINKSDISLADLIKQTITDCLKNITVAIPTEKESETEISEDESNLLDSLDDFLGM